MARNGFANVLFCLLQSFACSDAAWQVRNVGGPVRFCLLEYDSVLSGHGFTSKPAALRIDFRTFH